MYNVTISGLEINELALSADEAQATAYALACKWHRPVTVTNGLTMDSWEVMSDE